VDPLRYFSIPVLFCGKKEILAIKKMEENSKELSKVASESKEQQVVYMAQLKL
jgi:hypothetical protein